MAHARRAALTSVALLLLRRRLRRSDTMAAPVALLALDLLGPRIFQLRRLLLWALALTVVGGIVAAGVWWARRRRSSGADDDVGPAHEHGDAAAGNGRGVAPHLAVVGEDEAVTLPPDPAVA